MRITRGMFVHRIPYVRFGTGPQILLVFAGGPGNFALTTLGALALIGSMRVFCTDYTVYLVTRKSGLPDGYSTRDMSDDYAQLICDEFGGSVELVVGISLGGMIAQHFAADHADLFSHLVIVSAAHKISEQAKRLDVRYAELIGLGKDREAMAELAGTVLPDSVFKPIVAATLWICGKLLLGPLSDTSRRDIVIEAKAEATHDSIESLKGIKVPILIIGGRNDYALSLQSLQEMAAVIEKASLKIYGGGHMAVLFNKRFVEDVRQFVSRV